MAETQKTTYTYVYTPTGTVVTSGKELTSPLYVKKTAAKKTAAK